MAMTIGELDEYETENCLLCNLRDTAVGYNELFGGSESLIRVIETLDGLIDKELMEGYDDNDPSMGSDLKSDPYRD